MKRSYMKQICLDLHDFSPFRLGFTWISQLRQQYPNLKVSMFYIPVDQEYYGMYSPKELEEAHSLIKTFLDEGVIELIPHGLTHRFGEFQNVSYDDMQITLNAIEEHYKEMGFPLIKGFCAPNWLISKEAIKCLDDNKWWLAIDRNQPNCLKAKKNYIYNWSIDEPFPKVIDNVKAHGHLNTCANELAGNIKNLITIPGDYEWKFVSEIV